MPSGRIIENQQRADKKCEMCGKNIKYYLIKKGNNTKHFNIQSKPMLLYFCDRECKFKWIYQAKKIVLSKDIQELIKKFKETPN